MLEELVDNVSLSTSLAVYLLKEDFFFFPMNEK